VVVEVVDNSITTDVKSGVEVVISAIFSGVDVWRFVDYNQKFSFTLFVIIECRIILFLLIFLGL
jgi:hypothetical protein